MPLLMFAKYNTVFCHHGANLLVTEGGFSLRPALATHAYSKVIAAVQIFSVLKDSSLAGYLALCSIIA
jgi:hypothetical protein